MSTLKVLGICGSLRANSTNLGMLRYAQAHAPAGLEITIADLSEIPFYISDTAPKSAAVQTLLKQFEEAQVLLFACPEYNYSIAPALKNAIDWASRAKDNALLAGKPAAMFGAGGGMGTSRAQLHLRQVTSALNLHVLNKPEVFANAFGDAFDKESGDLLEERTQKLIVKQLDALLAHATKLA